MVSESKSLAPALLIDAELLLATSPDAAFIVDEQGRVLDANDQAALIFGCEVNRLRERPLDEFIIPPFSKNPEEQRWDRFLADSPQCTVGNRLKAVGLRLERDDGAVDFSEFPVEVLVLRASVAPGASFCFLVRDITERERAEEWLLQNQRTLVTLLSNLPGMAYRCPEDRYWELQFASEGAFDLTGYEPSELIGNETMTYKDLVHPDDQGAVWTKVRDALLQRAPWHIVYRLITKLGEEKWVLDRGRGVFSVFSEAGEIIALEGFVTDITDQKRAEKLLADYNRTLEEEVAERTEELRAKNAMLEHTLAELERTHAQLIMQEKMASLGALTAGIAHEIRNPLNFVNNFAALSVELAEELKEELANLGKRLDASAAKIISDIIGNLAKNAERIRDHGKRAESIIRSMLLHSRGSGREKRDTDINALLDEYVKLAYHGARATDPGFSVALKTTYDPTIDPIPVAPQDMGRVFLNILGNACQAVQEKKKVLHGVYTPEIVVSTKNIGEQIEIRIRDNGPGIPEALCDRIFEPFFTTKPAGQGTGLGLSIAYDLVVNGHGGAIYVETEEGVFTEFIIRVPKTSVRSISN